VPFVKELHGEVVIENGLSLLERDLMLLGVRRSFDGIPVELDHQYIVWMSGRASRLSLGLLGHQRGVEAGVVVHLELAVDLEVGAAGLRVGEQGVKAGAEVSALLQQLVELDLAAGAVGVVDIGAQRLLAHGVDLERHDGHAVDDAAGGLAVETGVGGHFGHGGVGLSGGGVDQAEFGQQDLVDALGGVVAGLVVLVDGALVLRDLVTADGGAARQVFFGPEAAVEEVVGADPLPQQGVAVGAAGHGRLGHGRAAGGGEGGVVEVGDLGGEIHGVAQSIA
jgi:hypothetical protein